MAHNIFGTDLPPGCSPSDLPGSTLEDGQWESLMEKFWAVHCTEDLWSKFDKVKLTDELMNLVERAVKYGIRIEQNEAELRQPSEEPEDIDDDPKCRDCRGMPECQECQPTITKSWKDCLIYYVGQIRRRAWKTPHIAN